MIFIIKIMIFICNFIYMFIKLFKTKNKITFISRQSDNITTDFKLMRDDLGKRYSNIEVVILTKKLGNGLFNKIKYIFHIFKQMYHIATSKIVILDSYCIPISILKHKKNLKVIQIWHALGALKKFGYSIEDQEEGTSSKLNKVMRMHKNYDYIFVSSEKAKEKFKEAFNSSLDKLLIYPLPRLDLLNDKKYVKETQKNIIKQYPNLSKKENIVYAPTFRISKSNMVDKTQVNNVEYIEKLIKQIDFKKYNLIIKAHPLSNLNIKDERVIIDKKFTTLDMLLISDYVITDYSAIVYEAAYIKKPLFFYAYDKDTYLKNREFYIDYKEMPGVISKSPKKIIDAIKNNRYDNKQIRKFSNENINKPKTTYTEDIDNFIISLINID